MRLIFYSFKFIFLISTLLITFGIKSYGQSFGLEFSSHEVVQDKRTSLDLSPDKPFYFENNFELSFDLSFVPDLQTYFGYVVRIIEDDKRNIDIIYNIQNAKDRFNMVIGERLSTIAFGINRDKLFGQWNRVRIKFDLDQDRIIVYCGGQSFVEKGVHLKKGSNYKILFGTNGYKQFQTTDTPPMRLRDVKIAENGTIKYNWPLNEEKGQIAHEIVEENNGSVNNPVWISAMHHDWNMAKSIIVNGPASITFDAKKELLYIVGTDSLYSLNVNSLKWDNKNYPSGNFNLNSGNESAFNPFNNNLYNIFVDQKFVSRYNPEKRSWDKNYTPGPVTNYWHFNKLFCKTDSSLYVFGGYGQLLYKNDVQQYNLTTNQWQKVSVKGDFFKPRYLAALGGTASGDTAYIIGGYGNSSGMQILNPENIYDILRFTVKDKTFKKLTQLRINNNDFAFANSLIINSKANTYYGLVFSEHKYNSSLQLISGSLNSPSYKLLGSPIPYSFHDIQSFADLYYCPVSMKFVAVTTLRLPNGQTKVSIYTLLVPPYEPVNEYLTANTPAVWFVLLITLLAGGAAGFYFFKKKKNAVSKINTPKPVLQTKKDARISLSSTEQYEPLVIHDSISDIKDLCKNSIFLFGDLQIFDAEGLDITKHFTPLIKELFLIILLHSIKWGRGLSSEKLNEILWYDKSIKSARNNRSVNITKLKSLLDRLGYCHLSKDTGYWKIEIDYGHVYADYHTYLDIIRDKKQLDIGKIKRLTEIVKRGNFLSNIEYEWLDPFKSEISNEVIDNLLHFVHAGNHSHDPELLIEIVNFIFCFDSINEEAMIIKCKALSALGKHSLARDTFENFTKDYKSLYGEEFKMNFHAVTE